MVALHVTVFISLANTDACTVTLLALNALLLASLFSCGRFPSGATSASQPGVQPWLCVHPAFSPSLLRFSSGQSSPTPAST